jgi:hypothetical protein
MGTDAGRDYESVREKVIDAPEQDLRLNWFSAFFISIFEKIKFDG